MAKNHEVVRVDPGGSAGRRRVVARTTADATGDQARALAGQFHRARKPGDSHHYEVAEAGETLNASARDPRRRG